MFKLKSVLVSLLYVLLNHSFTPAQNCASIDATTSASAKFKIVTGSQFCDTSATFVWQDGYSNGTRYFEYGTSTSYGNKSASLSGKSGTTILANLQPNTKYYWRANRLYNGKNPLTPAGSFTTKPKEVTTGTIDQNSGSNSDFNQKAYSIIAGHSLLRLPSLNNKKVTVSFYSMSGRLISKTEITLIDKTTQVSMENFRTGAYICLIRSGSKVLDHSIVMK